MSARTISGVALRAIRTATFRIAPGRSPLSNQVGSRGHGVTASGDLPAVAQIARDCCWGRDGENDAQSCAGMSDPDPFAAAGRQLEADVAAHATVRASKRYQDAQTRTIRASWRRPESG
jgi:hypothetical protein